MARKNRATLIFDARDETGGVFGTMENRLKSAQGAFFNFRTAVASVTALLAGGWVKARVDAGDEISKLTKQLNIGAEALSEYNHIAESANISFQSFTTALQRQGRRISEATQGTGEAVKALEALNLNANELLKLPLDQQFEKIADAMAGVSNQTDRSALAMKLWDTEGVKLLRLTGEGSAGLKEMRDQAAALGATMSQEQVDRMANVNQSFQNFQTALNGAANEVVTSIGPAIIALANLMADNLPEAVKLASDAFRQLGTWIESYFENSFRNIAAQAGAMARIFRIGPVQEWFQDIARSAGLAADRVKYFGLTAGLELDGVTRKTYELKIASGETFDLYKAKVLGAMDAHVQAFREKLEGAAYSEEEERQLIMGTAEYMQFSLGQRLDFWKQYQAAKVALVRDSNEQEIEDQRRKDAITYRSAQSFFGSMASLAQASGESNFKIYKAFAFAEATAAALAGANKAAAASSSAGPVATFAAYAAVYAKLIASAYAISKLQPGGGAGAPSGGGGYAPPAAPPQAATGSTGQASGRVAIVVMAGNRTIDFDQLDPASVDALMGLIATELNENGRVIAWRESPQAQEIAAAL